MLGNFEVVGTKGLFAWFANHSRIQGCEPHKMIDLRLRQALASMRIARRCALYVSLTLLLLCNTVAASDRGYAPQFSVPALDGGSITSSSLSGNVVLLQFWATWCQYCRADQPALDRVQSAYADQGLTVLAVDVGESPETVRSYLQSHPRSSQVALDQGHSMASQFGAHGFPYYVLIDRNGRIAGTQNGAGGEENLRYLIAHSGVFPNADRLSASAQGSAAPPLRQSRLIDVPYMPKSTPSKPLPKTIFFFANGEQLETDHYLLRPGVLELTVNGERRQVPLSDLDLKKTVSVNHERGIDFKVPTTKNEVFLAF